MPITKTDKKKNGLQGYRVRVNYTDAEGRYKTIERAAYGKSEAQALEQQLLSGIRSGETTVRMKMRALCDEYIAAKKHEIRETSLDKLQNRIDQAVIPLLGDTRLDALNARTLQKWKDSINERSLTVTTKRGYYTTLNGVLNYAVSHGYLSKNPLPQIGNFKEVYFEKPQDVLHYYTAEEYVRFAQVALRNAESKNTMQEWGYYVFFSLAFYTGARKGEINALTWADIDGPILHIRRSIAQKLKGADRETPPKNKSSYRDLQMPQALLHILSEHKCRQQADTAFSESWRICGGAECLRDTSIDHRNRQFADEAGLPHIRIHDFRHTHATLLVNNSISIQEIARRLGHSNVEQTWNTYAHLYPKEEERAVSILDHIPQMP